MAHRYSGVSRFTHEFIADQRDTLDAREMREARLMDASEPAAHRAWRGVLDGHSAIRFQINIIRRALFDMGAGLSNSGHEYIQSVIRSGWTWNDPRPDLTLIAAQKDLLGLIKDMPRRWAKLRAAEEGEHAGRR